MAQLKEGSVIKKASGDEVIATLNDLVAQLSKKVDKVAGKGLSTNDYTDEEKQKNQDNADNISNLQQEVNEHKAESASKHIKESGSNTNGSYIKFDDGTMICTHIVSKANVAAGDTFTHTWYFPITFMQGSQPAISITPSTSSSTPATGASLVSGSYSGLIGHVTCYTAVKNTDTSVRTLYMYLMAIGRWK